MTPSGDLEAASEAIVRRGFAVAGQLCISVQRVIAHHSITEALATRIVRRVRAGRGICTLMGYAALTKAIPLANATPYGLNTGIYTNDLREALTAARELVAGP